MKQNNYGWAEFGDPKTFQIALKWAEDPEPVGARPAGYGWSFGSVRIMVAGVCLTAGHRGGHRFDGVTWYLGPVFQWLARRWAPIFHEEDYAWPQKGSRPAALACHDALDRFIGTSDELGRKTYRASQSWYGRHALRSAAAGGLFPDLFLRRFEDMIEVSWTATPPEFAPAGFYFDAVAGSVRLPVLDVAAPLWEALQWVASNPPDLDTSFTEAWADLCRSIEDVRALSPADCDRMMIAPDLYERVRSALLAVGRLDLMEERTARNAPVVDVFSPAVAMYGGVSPELGTQDIEKLRDRLIDAAGGGDGPELTRLVQAKQVPLRAPYKDGYAFAEDLLDDLDLREEIPVDIRAICARLDIEVGALVLDTETIRGVAFAGEGFRPTVLVNSTSVFNKNEHGQRFTIAHELCHVLFDRARARRVAHVSGPWVAPAIEQRANAFAAYLLMPRELLANERSQRDLSDISVVRALAERLRVNAPALVEHLYNLDFIDEVQRESLKAHLFRIAS